MAERITDLIKFVFQYNFIPTKQNLNIYEKDLASLLIYELKSLFIYWDTYYLYLLNNLLFTWLLRKSSFENLAYYFLLQNA